MASNKLTNSKIKSLKTGKHGDGDNLWLYIEKSGTKRWVRRYTWHSKRVEYALGIYPSVGLSDARKRSAEIAALVSKGNDPRKVDKQDAAVRNKNQKTFHEVASEYIDINQSTWINSKHIAQWRMTILGENVHGYNYCKPIHNSPISEITIDDIESLLKPHWSKRVETTRRIIGRLERIFGYAIVKRYRTDANPAIWKNQLSVLLPRQNVEQIHHTAVPTEDLPKFYQELASKSGISALALQFTILTASRTGTIRQAKWVEVDLKKRIWSPPKAHMKNNVEHRVPLSEQALALLQRLRQERVSDYIFSGRKIGLPFSDNSMLKLMKTTMGYDATPHGTARSTFKDWALDYTDFPDEVSEQALAHVDSNKVRAAYRRGDGLEKRKELMQLWADYCYSEVSNG